MVNFYLLSTIGTLTYSAPEQNLGERKDQMADLYFAGQDVITAVREAEQSKAASRK
jgi:hypothetical protein